MRCATSSSTAIAKPGRRIDPIDLHPLCDKKGDTANKTLQGVARLRYRARNATYSNLFSFQFFFSRLSGLFEHFPPRVARRVAQTRNTARKGEGIDFRRWSNHGI